MKLELRLRKKWKRWATIRFLYFNNGPFILFYGYFPKKDGSHNRIEIRPRSVRVEFWPKMSIDYHWNVKKWQWRF